VGLVIPALLFACALNVEAATLEAIVRVESGGNAIALNVNRLQGPQPRPASVADAVRIAESYIARGFSVDVGLMQVNSRNLPALGYTLEQALDPCTNITAGGRILTANYAEVVRRLGEGQPALLAALSAYNTGDYSAGFRNGYVAKYVGSTSVPALAGGVRQAAASMAAAGRSAARKTAPNPYTADIVVEFTEVSNAQFVQ
jgi:type IV secretion system protein VirB1